MNSASIVSALGSAASNQDKAKFLTKLVDTFSSAVGTLYEPIGIRRRAGAEASAAITQAKAERDIKVIEAERDQQIQLLRIESRDVIADAKERSKERVRLRE
jgi:hypothetical protein